MPNGPAVPPGSAVPQPTPRLARSRGPRESVLATTPATGESDIGSGTPVAPDGAEIIDISGRIGDQVYDQYSDAANRAVGD